MNFKLKAAQSEGENIAKKFGGGSLPIDLSAIASRHNILVQDKPDIEGGVRHAASLWGFFWHYVFLLYKK